MPTKMPMALAALLAASALSSPAGADQQDAMIVVRDAHTGKLRNATAAEAKKLRAQEARRGLAQRATAPSPAVIRADGTMHKHLGESAMVYSLVQRDADGKLGMHCVNGADAVNTALGRLAPATGQERDHETR